MRTDIQHVTVIHIFKLISFLGCEIKHPIKNGSPIEPVTNTIGSIMKYKCITGYEPNTTPEVQCMGNGEWSLPEFHCVVCKSNYFLFCIHHPYLDSKY